MIGTLLTSLMIASENPTHQVLEIKAQIVPHYISTAPPRWVYENIPSISWKCELTTLDGQKIVSTGRFEEAIFREGQDVAYRRALILNTLGINDISGRGTARWSYSDHDFSFQIATVKNLYNIEMGAIELGKKGWMRLESAPNNGDDSVVEFRVEAMGFCSSENFTQMVETK